MTKYLCDLSGWFFILYFIVFSFYSPIKQRFDNELPPNCLQTEQTWGFSSFMLSASVQLNTPPPQGVNYMPMSISSPLIGLTVSSCSCHQHHPCGEDLQSRDTLQRQPEELLREWRGVLHPGGHARQQAQVSLQVWNTIPALTGHAPSSDPLLTS